MHLLNEILNLPATILNPWGYWIVLLGAILEANPITGFIIPGMTMVIAGGFFAKLNVLKIYYVMISASIGAILGDLVGYLMGKKYGSKFIIKYGKYFLFKEEYFQKTKKLINAHTGKTLILGRFNSITRAFAPFVAGSSDIPPTKFMIFNILGGILWAICFVTLGYAFEQSYEVIAKYFSELTIIATILVIFLIYTYKLINRKKHIFSKTHFTILTANIISIYIFSELLENTFNPNQITKLDILINTKMHLFQTPILTKIAIILTNLTSPKALIFLSIIITAILFYKKRYHHSILLFLTVSTAATLLTFTKNLIHLSRPTNSLIQLTGFSFPSGHTTISTAFFLVLIYVFRNNIKNKIQKYALIITLSLLPILTGITRIYLNAHWVSDVIAGFTLGIFCTTFLILLFKFILTKTKC